MTHLLFITSKAANLKGDHVKIEEEWARFALADFVKLALLSFSGPKVHFFARILKFEDEPSICFNK